MGRLLSLGTYGLFCFLPLALGLGYSLLYSLGLVGLLQEGFTLVHWQRLLGMEATWWSLAYTLGLSVMALCLSLVLAFGLAWAWFLRPGSAVVQKTLYLPLLLPPVVAGLLAYYLLSPAGVLARMAYHLGWIAGVEGFPRLVNDAYSLGLLWTHAALIFPVFVLFLLQLHRKERLDELWQVAQSLGAGRAAFFRSVYWPLLWRRIRSLSFLYATVLMGSYELPLLLGSSSPQVLSVFITDKLGRFNLADLPLGHAMAVLYAALVFVILRLTAVQKMEV
jgi:putative spermidine/putrescine transport system permease protein